MVDNLSESADDVKYNIDAKYNKNLYPVFMKESQNVWNWRATMDLRRTDIKQQNKNAYQLTFVFEHVNEYTMETRSKMFEWYNLYRNSSGKKSQRTAMLIDHFLS